VLPDAAGCRRVLPLEQICFQQEHLGRYLLPLERFFFQQEHPME
jgi:hypothetical protein